MRLGRTILPVRCHRREIDAIRRSGYHGGDHYRNNPRIARVVDSLTSGLFTADPELFAPLRNILIAGDYFCHLQDFESYRLAQLRAAADFDEPERWHRRALLTIARMGGFPAIAPFAAMPRRFGDELLI